MRTTPMNGTATIRQILNGLRHRFLMRRDRDFAFFKVDNLRSCVMQPDAPINAITFTTETRQRNMQCPHINWEGRFRLTVAESQVDILS